MWLTKWRHKKAPCDDPNDNLTTQVTTPEDKMTTLSDGTEDKMTTELKAVNDILTTLRDDTDKLCDDTDDPYVVHIRLPTDDSDEQSDDKDESRPIVKT